MFIHSLTHPREKQSLGVKSDIPSAGVIDTSTSLKSKNNQPELTEVSVNDSP
jgi:hypothetical protein